MSNNCRAFYHASATDKHQGNIVGDMAIQISICVCTYRRPGVVETVQSLLDQAGLSRAEHEIIVADDDPELSARDPILKFAENAPVEIRYVVSAARNISSCRNTCLDAAVGVWVAFIDDDQIAEPNWLQEMMDTALEFRADAVKCYVRAVYPPKRLTGYGREKPTHMIMDGPGEKSCCRGPAAFCFDATFQARVHCCLIPALGLRAERIWSFS